MSKKIVITKTKNDIITCYIINEKGEKYSIGFNNHIKLIYDAIMNHYNDDLFSNIMFDAFHKNLFYSFTQNMRQRAKIYDSFSIKYFYKLMWDKIYIMTCESCKYFDSISLIFVPSDYIFDQDLSFYMIKFLEKYFNIKVDFKIVKWINNYCINMAEANDIDKKRYLGIDSRNEILTSNEVRSLIGVHSTIVSEIKLSKDKKQDTCYMVVIWNDKTITKVTLPIKPKDILPSFKTGNNFDLLTSIPTLHKNIELKDIWNDNKKVKFLFNSFLICYLKQKYPKIKINSLLECVAFNILANIMDANNKLFDLLSIIVKMNDETYYKIMYKAFFN